LAGRLGYTALALPGARSFSTIYRLADDWPLAHIHVQTTVKGFPMETGTVKWYNETKGYGFIQPDNGGKDVFVHATALERAGMRGLREGQKISYELQTDQRTGRTSAVNLQNA
jgi:CspA family cold shock protein